MAGITRMLGIAIVDEQAGHIDRGQLLEILQEAIDNGDILLPANEWHVATVVIPLVREGVLRSSKHLKKFETGASSGRAEQLEPGIAHPSLGQQVWAAIRWVVAVPIAAIGAVVACVATSLLYQIGNGEYLDVNSFMGRVVLVYAVGVISGAAFVLTGAAIVPSHKESAALGFGALAIALCGFMLFPAVMSRDYWAIGQGLCVLFGASVSAYCRYRGKWPEELGK